MKIEVAASLLGVGLNELTVFEAGLKQVFKNPFIVVGSSLLVLLSSNRYMICDNIDACRKILKENIFYYDRYANTKVLINDSKKRDTTAFTTLLLNISDDKIMIDHIDHNKCNNKIGNLRPVSNRDNQRNQKVRNKTGVVGVLDRGNRYQVGINDNNSKFICVNFNKKLYGDEDAFYLAVTTRLMLEEEIGGYLSNNHVDDEVCKKYVRENINLKK